MIVVVIMDLILPELNGLDATGQILKQSPRTEVLVLTLHHAEELVRDVSHAEARGHVLKSDADARLICAVDSLRRHEPFLTAKVMSSSWTIIFVRRKNRPPQHCRTPPSRHENDRLFSS